jgi:hypothetical protein
MLPGFGYPCPTGFDRVRFRDTSGAGCTIVATFADDLCPDSRLGASAIIWAAIAASLVNVDADLELLKPGTVPTLIPLTVVPITPAAALQIVTAGGVKQAMIQADLDNAGNVYLGFDNTVDATNSFARLSPGESIALPHDVDVWMLCDAGANNVRGYAIL